MLLVQANARAKAISLARVHEDGIDNLVVGTRTLHRYTAVSLHLAMTSAGGLVVQRSGSYNTILDAPITKTKRGHTTIEVVSKEEHP